MIRTQIQLEAGQARRIRSFCRRHGVSMAEAIRRCIDKALPDEAETPAKLYERAWAVVGTFRDPSGATDISSRHDDYLAEGYE